MSKQRCSNCAYYPFCDKCDNPQGKCNNWRKKQYGATFDKVWFEEVIDIGK